MTRHWASMENWTPDDLTQLVSEAIRLKRGESDASAITDRILTMVFFNPSLRTRTSFEAAMLRYGGHAICLSVGGDTWKLEDRDGVVMDGDRAEHIKEAAPVLSRYGHALAVRTFAGMKDAAEDAQDRVMQAFAKHATVPVINMESAREHPCQGLADWMTVAEQFGQTRGRRFVLTWAPHVKPLPLAVPHSAILSAAAAGMHVTIAHPPGFDLNEAVVDQARQWCSAANAEFSITNDQRDACRSGDVVYVKSWGCPAHYGDADAQRADFSCYRNWTVDIDHLGPDARLMHCLPVRRNLVITDAALDDPRSVVVDQAENRMWAQTAILNKLWS